VRKISGVPVFHIVYLLPGNYTREILLAIIIAVPISGYAVLQWLPGFAPHAETVWEIFVPVALATLIIDWCTVSYETVTPAGAYPVNSLRCE
jgi:putative ABC transport system permease protein